MTTARERTALSSRIQKGEEKAQAVSGREKPYEQGQMMHIPCVLIDVGDQLVRVDPDDDTIVELAADIARRGLLQPIGVRAVGRVRYQLRFGHRRLLAHRRLKKATVWAIVGEGSEEELLDDALAENLHRRDLTLTEEVAAVGRMTERFGLSPAQIATRLGKGRKWVLDRLAVPNLDGEMRDALLAGELSLGAVEALARVVDPGRRRSLLQQVTYQKLTVRQISELVEYELAAPAQPEAVAAGLAYEQSADGLGALRGVCARCGVAAPLGKLTVVRICTDDCVATRGADDASGDSVDSGDGALAAERMERDAS